MAARKKRNVENSAISGLRLSGEDVASVSRDLRSMTLRHVWPEDVDGRVWDGVRRAFMRYAKDIATSTGKPVTVYAKEGWTLEQVRPED